MNKITEYIALFKLMQPLGKARIIMLGVEVLMLILLAGYGLNYINLLYIMSAVLVTTLYVMIVIIKTFK